ncbi:hypothetical protein DOT_0956, partial [Desulfosporosinus sp. OT]
MRYGGRIPPFSFETQIQKINDYGGIYIMLRTLRNKMQL